MMQRLIILGFFMSNAPTPGYYAYQAFNGLSLYFRGKYDYFKYHGKSSFSKPEKYATHPQRFQYAYVERFADTRLMAFLYAVFSTYDFKYVTPKTFFSSTRNRKVLDRFDVVKNIEVQFEKDLQKIQESITIGGDEVDTDRLYPLVHRLVSDQEISFETAILYHAFVHPVYVQDASSDIVRWPGLVKKVEMIMPFLMASIDVEHIRNLNRKHQAD